jgi:hypothetical protein
MTLLSRLIVLLLICLKSCLSRVTKLGGVNISSEVDDGDGRLTINESDEFFRVAISPEFDDRSFSGCSNLNDDDFELGGVVELEVVSYNNLNSMHEKYENNYHLLKEDLKLADIFDFSIHIEGMPEVSMDFPNGAPDGVEVLAKEYVLKVLKSDGSISNERISFAVW